LRGALFHGGAIVLQGKRASTRMWKLDREYSNMSLTLLYMSHVLFKGALLKDSEDEDVQIMTRTGSPFELMYGPLQLNLLLIFLGIYHFMTTEAAVLVAAVGLGDSVAPWIGTKFGRHVYRMPFGRSKTMEGSVCGVFLGTVIGCYFNLWFLGLPLLPLRILLAYAAIAAVTEGTAPSNMDNLAVPGVLYLSMERVIQWLPS
jgi:CDP-diglyceride synthetase